MPVDIALAYLLDHLFQLNARTKQHLRLLHLLCPIIVTTIVQRHVPTLDHFFVLLCLFQWQTARLQYLLLFSQQHLHQDQKQHITSERYQDYKHKKNNSTTSSVTMKTLISLFTLILALVCTAYAQSYASDYQYSQTCAKKNPAVNAAISAFCNKKINGVASDTIFCPGPRSNAGVVTGGVRAKITGNCSPPQWIPAQYCLVQFHYICATGGPRGMGSHTYGNNGCQKWTLQFAISGVGAVLGALGVGKRDDGDDGGVEELDD